MPGTQHRRWQRINAGDAPRHTPVPGQPSGEEDSDEEDPEDPAPFYSSSDPSRTPPECWICRDALSDEPLVRPCRCRGSMAGVHASCVEAWVHCHRQGANPEAPHCPVCKSRYGGSELRPGPQALAVQLSRGFAKHLARTAMEAARFVFLGTLLVQYHTASTGGLQDKLPGPIEVEEDPAGACTPRPKSLAALAPLALAIFLLHKLMVLSVSLPPQRPPPASRLARHFFTTDLWCTARHVAELLAAVVLLGARCFCGELPVAYFVPVALGALAPFAQLLLWYPVKACLWEIMLFLIFVACAPVLAAVEVGRLLWRHRQRFANLRDGPPHLALALVAVLLCLLFQSRRPVTVLFGLHTCFLAAGVLERLVMRRYAWQSGNAWWCALLVGIEAANLALGRWWLTLLLLLAALRSLQRAAALQRPQDLFQGPLWWCTLLVAAEAASLILHELRGPPVQTPWTGVLAVSWLTLLGSLSCLVNWRRCIRRYRGWQHQHATFVLCAPEHRGRPRASSSSFDEI